MQACRALFSGLITASCCCGSAALQELATEQHAANGQKHQEPMADYGSRYGDDEELFHAVRVVAHAGPKQVVVPSDQVEPVQIKIREAIAVILVWDGNGSGKG